MIKVTVQTEKRLVAITNLSIAIKEVARALSQGTHVTVSDCTFVGSEIGVNIDSAEDVNETLIKEVSSSIKGKKSRKNKTSIREQPK